MLSIVKNSVGLKNVKKDSEGTAINGPRCNECVTAHMLSANRAKMGKPLFQFNGKLENFAWQWGTVKGGMKKKGGFICEKMDFMAEKEKRIEGRLKNLLDKVEMLSAYAIREEMLAKVDTRLLAMECIFTSGQSFTIHESEEELKYCHELLHGKDCDCRLSFKARHEFGHLELPLADVNVFESFE